MMFFFSRLVFERLLVSLRLRLCGVSTHADVVTSSVAERDGDIDVTAPVLRDEGWRFFGHFFFFGGGGCAGQGGVKSPFWAGGGGPLYPYKNRVIFLPPPPFCC